MALLYQSPTRNLPEGYSFRGATLNDVPVVVYLFKQRQMTNTCVANFSIESIRHEWQTQKFNPAMDVRLIFDPREHLIGYIEVWTMLNSPAYPWLWGCVHPDYEGRGIGTTLLRWAEARVRLAMDMLPACLRVAPRFGALHTLTTAHVLCESLGWQPVYKNDEARSDGLIQTGSLNLFQKMGAAFQQAYDIYEKEIRPGKEMAES
jgi:GNAT superfamily N-acetyltransferase